MNVGFQEHLRAAAFGNFKTSYEILKKNFVFGPYLSELSFQLITSFYSRMIRKPSHRTNGKDL